MPAPKTALATGQRVYLRRPGRADGPEFVTAAKASAKLHGKWVRPPTTPTTFVAYVDRFGGRKSHDPATGTHLGMLARRLEDDALLGVFNLSEIVRGGFHSAYLGYYALSPHHGQGYMAEGIKLALDVAFLAARLHRVEVNVQPTNDRSIALARYAGFTREGFSRRYVKIAGRWRDHERWALLVEDWRVTRRRRQ